MTTFVDTSAFLAVLNRDDAHHPDASRVWRGLLQHSSDLLCTDYVLLETVALVQHRLGMDAVRVFSEDLLPLLAVEWVTPELYHAGMSALLTANRRSLSLTDCVSFEVMRRRAIRKFLLSIDISPNRVSISAPDPMGCT